MPSLPYVINPWIVAPFTCAAGCALERGEPGALDDLEKAATLGNRSDPVVLHWLAAALFEAGRHEEALTIQRSAVELSPTDAEMAEQLRTFEKATSNAGL